MPVITVITSSLNALPLLRHTAASIWSQTLSDLQWIIVDGASADDTPAWLKKTCADRPNCTYISEPDNGIYDAWNKALPLVAGEWVIFLGAGDKFKRLDTLSLSASFLSRVSEPVNLAYGAIEYIENVADSAGILSIRHWEGTDRTWTWCRPVTPNHQAMFHRTTFLRMRGGFDPSFRIAGDTALILPELIEHGAAYIPFCVTLRLRAGISLDPRNRARVLREVLRINRAIGFQWKRLFHQYVVFVYLLMKTKILMFLKN